jgi:hypothetical protein
VACAAVVVHRPGAQTGRRGWWAVRRLLGAMASAAALLCVVGGPSRWNHKPRIKSRHVDDFPAGSRDQSGEESDLYPSFEEMGRAIRKQDVGTARVKAIDFAVVATVKGTRARTANPIGTGTLDYDSVQVAHPRAAREGLVWPGLADAP